MPKPLSYREVLKRLKNHDARFVAYTGKGSERILYHPEINGRPESHPVKCHGEGTELRKGVLSSLIRRFSLPRDIFTKK